MKQTQFVDTIWLRFGVCSYLHPAIIFPISNNVHLLFPNPFCLHLTECSAVLYCDSMAHQGVLPPSQLHGPVFKKCSAPIQRQMCRSYSQSSIWYKSSPAYFNWWLYWSLFTILLFCFLSLCFDMHFFPSSFIFSLLLPLFSDFILFNLDLHPINQRLSPL